MSKDAEAWDLAQELRRTLRGEVRFDKGSRAVYSTDASNYRQVPIGVVIPRDVDDLVSAVEICRRHGAPIVPRGGGTSLAGQCCNVAVVLDTSKYMREILELDPGAAKARVQPGVVLDDLRDAAERHHLTFAPDPSTHNHCTLGGMVGNNSCGVHSLMGGNTVDNIEELEILTYDGLRMRVGRTTDEDLARIVSEGGRRADIYARLVSLRDRYGDRIRRRYPRIPRRVSGYNLDQLLPENGFDVARALVGTEGTCVTVLEATAQLVPSPPGRSLLVLAYPDVYAAGQRIMEILAHAPIAVEGLDELLVDAMRQKGMHREDLALLPDGGTWLFLEFGGGSKVEADARARDAMRGLERGANPPTMRVYDDPAEAKIAWLIRQSAPRAASRIPGQPDSYDGWEDAAVPPEHLGEYLRDFRGLLDRFGYRAGIYGHFGQGCIHTRIDFDLKTAAGVASFRSFVEDAADLVVRYGGSLSGEHGDGQARGELLARMYGDELVDAFREFKAIWDPEGKMNPGKVVDSYRLDQNLRLGPDYSPPPVKTRFSFKQDDESFPLAIERCIGIGECRRIGGGTMCPSYMATLEEEHSTRGRARMLFEMLRGGPIGDGWRSEAVKAALDLCLACKACKSECPANVDMASYKAEFLSHYYEGRRRPITAYTLGLIDRWSRLAARAPGIANLLMQTPVLRDAAKAVAGIARERRIPPFAARTFVEGFAVRKRQVASSLTDSEASPPSLTLPRQGEGDRSSVILWPDTFTNHFHPEIAHAAVEVLEAAGFEVELPPRGLCCGRPLYDYGRLDDAKRALAAILDALGPALEEGLPIVGLEPSCVAVFRDELPSLFPHDERARQLSERSFLLSELLQREAPDFTPPTLRRRALLHPHCHQRSLIGTRDDAAILDKLGLDYRILDAGCCGMAGAFGFEKEHYAVSMQIGERALLPAVREASADTPIIADGFSCREQIAQATGRQPLHMAQVIQLALREGAAAPD
jgi:FAD/FMN-containing dehydrogenase/Fe-S oxidoreductase